MRALVLIALLIPSIALAKQFTWDYNPAMLEYIDGFRIYCDETGTEIADEGPLVDLDATANIDWEGADLFAPFENVTIKDGVNRCVVVAFRPGEVTGPSNVVRFLHGPLPAPGNLKVEMQ